MSYFYRCGYLNLAAITIFLILTIKLWAQEPIIRVTDSTKYAMQQDNRQLLVRWAGTTVGLSLSNEESILIKDEQAILVESNGHPSKLMATYSFNPQQLPEEIRQELTFLKVLLLRDINSEGSKQFHELPDWSMSFPQIDNLTLIDADLREFAICRHLPLKVLNLRNVKCENIETFLGTLENLKTLEIMVYDDSFSGTAVSVFKEKLPKVMFLSK